MPIFITITLMILRVFFFLFGFFLVLLGGEFTVGNF